MELQQPRQCEPSRQARVTEAAHSRHPTPRAGWRLSPLGASRPQARQTGISGADPTDASPTKCPPCYLTLWGWTEFLSLFTEAIVRGWRPERGLLPQGRRRPSGMPSGHSEKAETHSAWRLPPPHGRAAAGRQGAPRYGEELPPPPAEPPTPWKEPPKLSGAGTPCQRPRA